MSADEGVRDALVRHPLPEGFTRRVFRVAPGLEVRLEPGCLLDAIVVVEQGELELEYEPGTWRRFGRGLMFPIALLPVSRLRNVGPFPLVLVAVSRRSRPTDGSRGASRSR